MKDPPFLVSKSSQPLFNEIQIFVCDFSKLGPIRVKIGKYLEICMKMAKKWSNEPVTFSFSLQSS